jgi:hypothetical protein
MQVLAELCVLLYVATVTIVGARMLLLARKTGGRPERLLGAGSLRARPTRSRRRRRTPTR